VAPFTPTAARKAYLASGRTPDDRMSLFSVGGGLGFAYRPALTTSGGYHVGHIGVLALLAPAAIIALCWLKARRGALRHLTCQNRAAFLGNVRRLAADLAS